MNDKEYAETKERLEKYLTKWHALLGMGHYFLKYNYVRETCQRDDDIAAETSSTWEYRRASITWYMPKLLSLTDEEIENFVVHEFCHVMMSPITQNAPEDHSEQVELATENFAVALVAVHNKEEVLEFQTDRVPLKRDV